jgi:hypothetical protein
VQQPALLGETILDDCRLPPRNWNNSVRILAKVGFDILQGNVEGVLMPFVVRDTALLIPDRWIDLRNRGFIVKLNRS